MTRIRTRPRAVGGSLSKVLHSSAALSLIPGLRKLEALDDLRFGLAFHTPPRIEFVPVDDGDTENPDAPARALIRLRLAGTELSLWGADDDEPLGTVRIDSAVLTVAPYLNLLGGVSFETIENRWELSSHGLEFDEAGLAATLQELFFGEMFQTTYDPVGRDSLELGETRFNPRYFSLLGNYLVIRLSGL